MSLRPVSIPLLALLLAGGAMAQPATPQPAPDLPDEGGRCRSMRPTAETAPAPPAGQIDLDDVRKFTALLSLIKQAWRVEPVDDHASRCRPRSRACWSARPSEYLVPGAGPANRGRHPAAGEGPPEVTTADCALRVIAPIDDTPAARAGMGGPDLRIDNVPVKAD